MKRLQQIMVITTSMLLMTGCQHMSTRTLNFGEQTAFSAKDWIKHNAASNQQKQALLKVNQAQQRIKQLDFANNAQLNTQLFEVTKQNQLANHCAMTTGISLNQINALKAINFQGTQQVQLLARYEQESPRIKLDINAIQCDFDAPAR